MMAIDGANEGNGIPGYRIETLVLDDGTATAGQYDPAQAATNARKMVSDKDVVAALGPEMSGAGKAMAPILIHGRAGDHHADLDQSGHHRPEIRPAVPPGRQADLLPHRDDRRLPGPEHGELLRRHAEGEVGLRPGRQRRLSAWAWPMRSRSRPGTKGIKVLGRDRLDPKAADYTAILTKIKSLNPDALYYGGVGQAGVKLAKQAYDIVPKMIKGGGDGVVRSGHADRRRLSRPTRAGTPPSPRRTSSSDQKAQQFVDAYFRKYNDAADDYTITAYDAALVIDRLRSSAWRRAASR